VDKRELLAVEIKSFLHMVRDPPIRFLHEMGQLAVSESAGA
jgi:hypothetical protein